MPTQPLRARIRDYSEITNVGPILRRYFVIGAFDGALTILGIILGAFVAGASEHEKSLILAMSFSAAIALAISSTVGAYEAERIEKKIAQMSMERAMLSEMSEMHKDAFQFAAIASAVVHGIAPLVAGLVPVVPFLLLPFADAALWSVAITLAGLFVMGVYMGRLAKEHVFVSGMRLVVAGLATAIILWLIGGHP